MSPRDYDKEATLPKFSLDRRIAVLMLALTIAVIGVIAALNIPAEMFPSGFVSSMLMVQVPWQDAPPREVLDKITIPIEEELGTVRGVDRITSVSMSGMAQVFVVFKQSSDMDVAYREVRDRVERARVDFPSDVDRVFIRKNDISGFPIYMIGIAIDPDLDDPWDLIQNDVIIPVERLEGVGTVQAFGLEEKEILIELDRERTNAAGLNIYEMAQDLGADNFTMASGSVLTGSRKLLLRSVASYRSVEELENRLVGLSTRLKDVARITYDEPDKNYRARINGTPAVAVQIIKESEANTREVTRRLDRQLEELRSNSRLANLEMVSFFSQGEIIDESLGTLIKSGMFGGVLASIVLFFFMRRVRLTLIVAFSIPISLVVGLTVMYFAGETLNLLTLIGLMICIGLLVDNSVVVAENIHRLHRDGLARRDACIRGAGEVALAITMSTLTTVIVFLPAALIEGPMGFFLTRMAVPVAVSVLGSLVVALVFVPLCVYLTLSTREQQAAKPSKFEALHRRFNELLRLLYDNSFGRMNESYNKLLAKCLDHRFGLIAGVVGVLILSINVYGKTTEFVGQQDDEQAQFHVEFELPPSTTLDDASEYFNAIEQAMEDHREELGLEGYFIYNEETYGEMDAWFFKDNKDKPTVKEAMKMLVEAFPEKPGVEVFAGNEQQGADKKSTVAQVFVRGEDPDAVTEVVNQLAPLFVQIEGVLGRNKSGGQIPNELGLVIDREKAQHLNVNPQVIAGVVGYALRGQSLPKFHADGREVPVRVRFAEEDRESLSDLNSFQVPTRDGSMLPLSALTSTTMLPESTVIVRREKMIGRTISLELQEGKEEETRARIIALQSSIDLPEGISFGDSASRVRDLNDDLGGIRFAMTLSIVFIYLLMGFLFESFILPLSILVTIPLSSIGMMWGHILTGRDLDFLGGVAMILLVGIVVNNGIVLIDYVNRLRAEGHPRKEAMLMATHRRFRPIMMTAITTIGGMIPLALAGANSIGLSYTSFSITLIGGLATATLLTLLVVPVFYTLFDDLRLIMAAAINRKPAAIQEPVEVPERLDPSPGPSGIMTSMHVHAIDGTYELFRAYFGAPPAKTPAGDEIGAVRALARSMLRLVRSEGATHVGIAFDHTVESFRNDLFDGYKTGEGLEAELDAQFYPAEEVCRALGFVVWPMVEFEADDALATAASIYGADSQVESVRLCTPDKDLAQCVQGERIVTVDRRRSLVFDEAGVRSKFGVSPASMPDYLALVGDTADGIPGIPRWGAKSAAIVLTEYGHVDNIPDDAAAWSIKVRGAPALAANLAAMRKEVALYRELATLRTDAPLTESVADLRWRGPDPNRLQKVCDELGDGSLVDRARAVPVPGK